jgi:hypothetical protein
MLSDFDYSESWDAEQKMRYEIGKQYQADWIQRGIHQKMIAPASGGMEFHGHPEA